MQDSSSATPSSSAYLQHCFQHTYLRCTPENQPFLAFHWVDHVDLWFGHVWPLQESNGKPKTEKFEDLSSLLGAPWDWSFAAGTATHMPKCGSQPTWMIFIQVARLDCIGNDHVQNLTYNLYLTNVYPKVTAVALKSTFFGRSWNHQWPQPTKRQMSRISWPADSADLIGIFLRQRQIGPADAA